MTLYDLLEQVQKLVDEGKGDCEVRIANDLSYGNVYKATEGDTSIQVAHIIRKPTEMDGVLAMSDGEAEMLVQENYKGVPLNMRDDEELETEEFALVS